MAAQVFDTRKRANDYASKKNKRAKKYKYIVKPYGRGFVVLRVSKNTDPDKIQIVSS